MALAKKMDTGIWGSDSGRDVVRSFVPVEVN